MANYWERREEIQQVWRKYSHTQPNSRLKYTAIGFIVLAAVAMITLFIILVTYNGEHSTEIELIFRIFAGLCALVGIILYMILSYRIYSISIKDRWKTEKF